MEKISVLQVMIQSYKYIFLLLTILCSTMLDAQVPVEVKRSENKIVLEGKIYFVHIVEKGHTLYSIARAYEQTEKAIIIENPGASSDLIIGQVLKIPAEKAPIPEIYTADIKKEGAYHVMKEGETVYSISRRYRCTDEEIMAMNPNLDQNDIPIGTKLYLPGAEAKKVDFEFDEEGFLYHRVKAGETLSSIARYYESNVRNIRDANPEVGWGRPRSGDVLRIPRSNSFVEEIFAFENEEDEDVSASLETDSSDMPVYDYAELFDINHKRGVYNVAYLIPFSYEEMEPLDSILKDYTSPRRIAQETEDYMLEQATPKSINALEFLEGSLMAIDSMTDRGMKLRIHVYDTKRSMARTREILDTAEMKNMDLIIGPFYPYNMELVNDFSKEHKIPVVNPFGSNDSVLNSNPYHFQSVPSLRTEFDRNAKYIGRIYDSNLIYVHSGDSSRMEDMAYYREKIFNELRKYSAHESVLFKEVIIPDGNMDMLVQALNPALNNLIILPAIDEAFASQVASRLYYELANFDIEIFGSSYWHGFDDIEINYIHALRLKVSHTHWYSYTDTSFLSFMSSYRQNFINEPRVYTRRGYNFGIVGYDLSLYFLSALKKYGKRFPVRLSDFEMDKTQCHYIFERVSRSGGFENRNMNYYFFDKDLDVKTIELPDQAPVHHYLRPAGIDPVYYQWSQPQRDSTDVENENEIKRELNFFK